ncbi:MAG: ISAzo13 family transposase, partial [Syntrophales bacterium]
MDIESAVKERYQNLEWALDERLRRLFAASEAKAIGHGGIALVWKATGVARGSIQQGLKELVARPAGMESSSRRIRRVGAGRKTTVSDDAALLAALESLVEPVTRGDPESSLRWTCKSLRQLATELGKQGYSASHTSIGGLLKQLGYSLQGNRKTLEGADHPDRNSQFEYINARVEESLSQGQPVISVDTKKKELVGQFKNGGKEWRPEGDPEKVNVYDFVDKELGRANPYGVYDLANNAGWVSVGTDHDTAGFAVATIRRWWLAMGLPLYPDVKELLITADGGGSNGSRVRLWKLELQQLSDELGIPIRVSHFPPGTSKWNKIEHRLFSHISM